MNRAKLLALAKSEGYAGEATLDKLKAWLTEQGIEFKYQGKAVDVDAAWKATKSVDVADEADEATDEPAESPEVPATKAAAPGGGRPGIGAPRTALNLDTPLRSAGEFSRERERKNYDRKAAVGETKYVDSEAAEMAGAFYRATVMQQTNRGDYAGKTFDDDILKKTMASNSNTAGGVLVPEIFDVAGRIDLRERYGDFANAVGITRMAGPSMTVPRRVSGLTVYSPTQGGSITSSDVAQDQVGLNAIDMWTLTAVSEQLFEDSAINIGELVTGEIDTAFSLKTDQIYLYGDGTSTYFNQVGWVGKTAQLVVDAGGTAITNDSYAAGITTASGNAFSEVVYPDFLDLLGRVGNYGGTNTLYCSQQFWTQVMLRCTKNTSGVTTSGSLGNGVTQTEVVNGVPQYRFEGVPVKICQAMIQREANHGLACLYGDLSRASKIGYVGNSFRVKVDSSYGFANGLIYIRGQTRVAITVHDIGNAHATAASRVFGPAACMFLANS